MTKSTSYLLLASAVALGAVSRASAAYPIADGAELYLTLRGAVQANDNIFLGTSGNETSDTIIEVTPGIEVLFGQTSLSPSSFTLTETFKNYADEGDLDTSLTTLDYRTAFDDGKLKLNLDAGYQQLDQATRDVRGAGLIRRDVTRGGVVGESNLTFRSSLRAGVTYNETDYSPTSFADLRTVQIPINYYYELTPLVDASVGFRYKDNKLGNNRPDSNEYIYSVGVRGEVAPKLTGELSAGFHQFRPDAGKDAETFGLASNFSYAYSPKTTLSFGASNDYGFSSVGDTYRNFGITFGATATVSSQLSINALVGYNKYSYETTTQKDDFISGQLSANYAVNEKFSVIGTYLYADNDSSLPVSTFSSNILNLAGSLRF